MEDNGNGMRKYFGRENDLPREEIPIDRLFSSVNLHSTAGGFTLYAVPDDTIADSYDAISRRGERHIYMFSERSGGRCFVALFGLHSIGDADFVSELKHLGLEETTKEEVERLSGSGTVFVNPRSSTNNEQISRAFHGELLLRMDDSGHLISSVYPVSLNTQGD